MTLPNLTRWQWLKATWLFAIGCSLIAYAISSQYLPYIKVNSSLGAGYLTLAFIGQIGFLALLLAVPLSLLTTLIRQRHLNYLVLLICASLTLLILSLDTQVYALYRFHLSGFVWNLAFGEGGSQIFHFSWYTIAFTTLGAFTLIVIIAATLYGSLKLTERRSPWLNTFGISAILLSFLGANMLHVWHDAHGNTEIRAMTRHLPLYQPATAVRFMAKQGWIDPYNVNQQASLAQGLSQSALTYPTTPLSINANKKPNILFVTVDAWRADTFDAQTTPFTYSLTNDENAQHFLDHHSGGNVTKGGIFSLFYALPPTYWDAFTAAQQPPIFLNTLQANNYATGIFGSSPLINPSFHRNVFSGIQNLTKMTEGETPSERDRQMVANFQQFLDEKDPKQPFVGFLFFDAAHGYEPPEDYQPKFEPYWERVDHVDLDADFDPLPFKNRYRTSLHFIDTQIKQVIIDLQRRNLFENSIIVFTSDHGEEFNETKGNYWGHGSNFTHNQTQVPLLILWPNREAQTIHYRTSHYDIAPTLLEEGLGVTEDRHTYSVGHSLFEEGNRDWLLVHSYFNYGLVMKDRLITTFPTGQFEITDTELKPTNLPLPADVTLEVLDDISRFYK